MAIVTEAVLTGGLAATSRVGGAPEAAAKAPALSDAQAANLGRFEGSLPKGAGSTAIKELPNGGRALQAEVPGKVPGSKAVYEKQIGANGKPINYTKTTYDPKGSLVHAKVKYQAPPEKP